MVAVVQEVVLQSIVPSRKVEGGLQETFGLVGRRETVLTRQRSRRGGVGVLLVGDGVQTRVGLGSPDRSGLWWTLL
jgi:hypothetical protein